MKNAFTMIELVFVIVILGILAGVALPRLAVTRDDATITKLRADVQAIRSGINLKKNQNLMRGRMGAPELGEGFANILDYSIADRGGQSGWKKKSGDGKAGSTYEVCIKKSQCATFTYTADGNFSCSKTDPTCKLLTGN